IDAQDSRHRTRNAMGRNTYASLPWSRDALLVDAGALAALMSKADADQRVVAGARIDRARAEDQRATTGMMGMPNPTAGEVRRETLPSGFVRYEYGFEGTPLGWYAGLGHARRMPDYWELFSADMGPPGSANAFSSITPERTTQLDVGLQYRTRRLDAWVSAYAGRLDDYLLFRYDEAGMMGPMSSVSNVDARIHGAEAGIEWRPAPAWTTGGSLAWAWGENREDNRPLPQMPPLEARLSLTWGGERWSFGSLLRVAARQDRVSIDEGNVVGRDLGPAPGFAVFSLNGGYRFGPRAQLTAGVDNLFDRDYAEHLNLSGSADFGYPADPVRIHEPGRTAWVLVDRGYGRRSSNDGAGPGRRRRCLGRARRSPDPHARIRREVELLPVFHVEGLVPGIEVAHGQRAVRSRRVPVADHPRAQRRLAHLAAPDLAEGEEEALVAGQPVDHRCLLAAQRRAPGAVGGLQAG